MSKLTLPRLNQTGANEWGDVEANDVAIRELINGGLDNENIAVGANIARSKLEGGAQGIAGQWYTPKVIETEESRTNVAFGTLTTADEIPGVVVPTNGKLVINYRAHVKSSVAGAGRVALFVGANQLTNAISSNSLEGNIGGTAFGVLRTEGNGTLTFSEGVSTADSATGFLIGAALEFAVPAGTYTVSAQYKATSGSVTAKERKFWVEVHGV
jgi:hypothetical protein